MNFLAALCLALVRFLASCFRKNTDQDLPRPVTTRQSVLSPLPHISLSALFPAPTSPRSCHETPTAPSPSSAVIVHLDRSPSPSTMSDGSLEVISLSDLPPVASPLPSPWSPIGKPAGVWMTADGLLMNASGPVDRASAHSRDDSDSTATPSGLSSVSLYSSSSAFGAFGISVFANLNTEADKDKDDSTDAPKPREEHHPARVETPLKRRQTLSSIAGSNATHNSRAKCFSTPLTKLEINHLHSASSISSMAYELRMGLFADGRSMSAFQNIISLLDQTTPESTPPHNDPMPVEVI